ncbi:hypothetical protein QLG07_11140 [Erwinia sp. V90_4]|uniref:hypothetical protein n=1 Tax=Erwinia sp. V90_4 TaxID=3044239 RepID=UPI00249E434D|nr:hypothetical protein [Erwinia sp. V90_4]MDI3440015.1 hypothetical protein [Erwinia sp. V90_4]
MSARTVYAVDSAASIENLKLIPEGSDEASVDLKKFIPDGFKGKVIVNIEDVGCISQSLVSLKENPCFFDVGIISSAFRLEIKTTNNIINNFLDESILLNNGSNKTPLICSAVDIPYVATGVVPETKKDLVEMSKVLNLYVIYSDDSRSKKVGKQHRQVFDAYGTLGFAIVDIEMFDRYVSMKDASNDLVEEFTTTELANELFDEGLMILSWGHTPWVYYINSASDLDTVALLGEYTNYSGFYKFKNEFKQVSVIPGNELRDWSSCKDKKWPVIDIDGQGEYVSIKLYVKNAVSQSDSDYPIPTFKIERVCNEGDTVSPLLQSNILEL